MPSSHGVEVPVNAVNIPGASAVTPAKIDFGIAVAKDPVSPVMTQLCLHKLIVRLPHGVLKLAFWTGLSHTLPVVVSNADGLY